MKRTVNSISVAGVEWILSGPGIWLSSVAGSCSLVSSTATAAGDWVGPADGKISDNRKRETGNNRFNEQEQENELNRKKNEKAASPSDLLTAIGWGPYLEIPPKLIRVDSDLPLFKFSYN